MAAPEGTGRQEPFEGEQLAHVICHLLGLQANQFSRLQSPSKESHGARLQERDKTLAVVFSTRKGTALRTEGFRFTRPHGTFSRLELELCDAIAKGAEALWVGLTAAGLQGTIRTAVHVSALQLGLARLLRPSLDHFWSVSSLISLVQNLTFRRYEGRPCTSGFLCFEERPPEFTPRGPWRSLPLKRPVDIDHSFFDNVASYRYVDGLARYYVAALSKAFTTRPSVFATVELTERNSASLVHLARYGHVEELLLNPKSFLLCANRNSGVDICPARHKPNFLRWTKGAWRIVNVTLMDNLLKSKSTGPTASAVLRAVLALSLLRLGTLILIRDRDRPPPAGGRIDTSELAVALRQGMKGQNIDDLVKNGQFINVLSSDGMIVIDPKGMIEEAGWLVPNPSIDSHRAGGARTAAAKAASELGLVAKVSADGPISFFEKSSIVYETC